ncbi:TMhelix containing protein [Vibrio phage 1.121.O._10N.286.46.C4]|nr:TMhelix containing protein [Vibrio phage 1.121.O._10N.286.46.C4]
MKITLNTKGCILVLALLLTSLWGYGFSKAYNSVNTGDGVSLVVAGLEYTTLNPVSAAGYKFYIQHVITQKERQDLVKAKQEEADKLAAKQAYENKMLPKVDECFFKGQDKSGKKFNKKYSYEVTGTHKISLKVRDTSYGSQFEVLCFISSDKITKTFVDAI